MFVCLDELIFLTPFEQMTGTENLKKHSHDVSLFMWMSFINFILQ